MTEMLEEPTMSNEGSQQKGDDSQYIHQTVTLHNTVGLVFMSILAFALLLALLRQQARYHELTKELWQRK